MLEQPSSVDRVARVLHDLFPPFNDRQLTWDDVVALAAALEIPVQLLRGRHDAALRLSPQGAKIAIHPRVNPATWGVFCVAHELAHHLTHPGPREFYLGSPGWEQKTESQANVIALLALWPFRDRRPYPRVLKIHAEEALVTFDMHYLEQRAGAELGPQWISRKLTLQRYR